MVQSRNLVYTALGGSRYPKETMTVFVDGQTYQMNNYSELVHFGQGQNIWQSRSPQKGHLEELRAFLQGLSVVDNGQSVMKNNLKPVKSASWLNSRSFDPRLIES